MIGVLLENVHKIKLILNHLKCTIKWRSILSQCCAPWIFSISRPFQFAKQNSHVVKQECPILPLLQLLVTSTPLSVSMELPVRRTWYLESYFFFFWFSTSVFPIHLHYCIFSELYSFLRLNDTTWHEHPTCCIFICSFRELGVLYTTWLMWIKVPCTLVCKCWF